MISGNDQTVVIRKISYRFLPLNTANADLKREIKRSTSLT